VREPRSLFDTGIRAVISVAFEESLAQILSWRSRFVATPFRTGCQGHTRQAMFDLTFECQLLSGKHAHAGVNHGTGNLSRDRITVGTKAGLPWFNVVIATAMIAAVVNVAVVLEVLIGE
jgi:hypothetical protein